MRDSGLSDASGFGPDDSSRLAAIKDILDSIEIGVDSGSFDMILGSPFPMSPEESSLLASHIGSLGHLLHEAREVYKASQSDPSLFGIRDLLEGTFSEAAKAISREAISINQAYSPAILRADFIDFHSIAEIQTTPTGLAAHHAIDNLFRGREVFEPSAVSSTLAKAIRDYTGMDTPKVLFFVPFRAFNEMHFFSKVLTGAHGIPVDVISIQHQPRVVKPGEYDLIFWKGTVQDLIEERYLQPLIANLSQHPETHKLFVPELSCLKFSKAYLLLPFLPETSRRYSDKDRALIPGTRLITREVGDELAQMPISRRKNVVVKYIGQDLSLNWGSKGVFMLGSSRKELQEILELACRDPERSPWIAQERIRTRFDGAFLGEDDTLRHAYNLSARIGPHFVRSPNGQLLESGTTVMLSRDWKCHGNERNIICAVKD